MWVTWREYDGEETRIQLLRSVDGGRSFDAPVTLAATTTVADYPRLIADGRRAFVSWYSAGTGYRLIPATLAARKVAPADARAVIKAAALRFPQVALAWTRDELLDGSLSSGPALAEWRLSFNAARSQDVVLTPKPYVVDRSPHGTNHGTPYEYDTHIPLLWYGAGIRPGRHIERIGSDAIAPTLAALLGVPRPPEAHADPAF